jgi:Carboxypeptidase regulatory-like domain/TonB dependent receptor
MRLAVLFLCLTIDLIAQSDRGAITGTVSDPAGAVIPSAPVEAKNSETGAVYMAATSTTGNYTIAQLPAGTYELSVTVPGFKRYTRGGLLVQVAQVLRVDVAVEVGAPTESITVQAESPLLDTETGNISHSVKSESLDQLPVLGIGATQAGSAGIRNPMAMVQLIPGSLYMPNTAVRINGTPANTQSLLIEGQEGGNTGQASTTQQSQPSVDAIQEVAIQTSNYAAEYGQVGGGVFTVTMKSGTNQFHGTGYDYFVNEILNAGQPFTDAPAGTGNPRQVARRNDYGFTVGGPAWIPKVYNGHNRTFFFFAFEQYRETTSTSTQLETVPTAAYREGNFGAAMIGNPIGTDPLGRPILQNEIYDPTTQRTASTGQVIRDPFPNNTIPSTRFDPVAINIQNLFPAPMGPFANAVVNNFVPTIIGTRVTTIPSLKVDQIIGPRAKVSFFWQQTKTWAPISPTLGQTDGLPDPIGTELGTFDTAPLVRLNFDYSMTPTVLLHLGAGYRNNNFFTPAVTEEGNPPNYNAGQLVGLNGALVNKLFPSFTGLCPGAGTQGLCTGQGGMQNFGQSGYSHAIGDPQSPSFDANLTWVKNNHTFKMGSSFRTEGYIAILQSNTSGSYVFSNAQTSLPYLNGATLQGLSPGFPYASFLLGDVQQVSISQPTEPRIGKHQLGIYAQDSWKITRKLTFDYGLRYDYSTWLREQYGRNPVFSTSTPNPAVGNILGAVIFNGNGPGHCNCQIAHNYPYAGAPRLGLAYQINSKTVFRGGFGIIYGGTEGNQNSNYGGSSNTVVAPSYGAAVTTLSVGIPTAFDPPPWPNLNPGQFNVTPTPVNLGASAPLLDPNAGRPPRQYQWSLGFQREIIRDLAVDLYYVGNRGIWWESTALENPNAISSSRLSAFGVSLNNPTQVALLTDSLNNPAVIAAGFGNPPYPGFPLTQTLAQALRPFPQFTTINPYWDPLGDTWYDSLQIKATKRLSHGLSFLSTFVWQKSLTNGTELGQINPGTTGDAVVNDVFNRRIDKYLSAFDQPFLFNISLTYITPKLATNKVLSYVARDWTYGAFLQYASGTPIEVPLANNNLSSEVFQTTFANRVPGQPLFTVNLNCHCYDPNATFVLNPNAWTNPQAGQFGTSAAYYNDYRTQRRPIENMNLGRTWRIKERVAFNLRMEFTNVFNRAFWNNPSNSNFQATQTRLPNGNTASGFGYINTITTSTGANIPVVTNISPRSGVLVAHFTF